MLFNRATKEMKLRKHEDIEVLLLFSFFFQSVETEDELIFILPLGAINKFLDLASSFDFVIDLLFFQFDFHEEVEANLEVFLAFNCLST